MSLQQNSEEKSMMEILVDYFNEQVFTNQSASLQRFQTALPSICLQGRKEQVTQRANILGEYKASMDFAIVVRIDKDTLPMEVYRIFDDVHKQLILHQERVIYPILPNGYRCYSLQQTTFPQQITTSDDTCEEYEAIYTLTYEKKSTYN